MARVITFISGPLDGATLSIPPGLEVLGGEILFRLSMVHDKSVEHGYVVYSATISEERICDTAQYYGATALDKKPFDLEDFDAAVPAP